MRLGFALLFASSLGLAQVVEVGFTRDPGPLDFIRGGGPEQATLQALLGDALLGVDNRGALVPRLAHRWEARKGELRFTLRQDATFPDGTHVTVQDALWTLQELQRNPEAEASKKRALEGASLFIQAHQLVVRSPRAGEALLRDLARIPITRRGRPDQGCGPFRLLREGSAWTVHRRAHYLAPRLEGFRFRLVQDEAAALREGRLHLGAPGREAGPPPPSHRSLPSLDAGAPYWVDQRLEAEGNPLGPFGGTPGPAAWRWKPAGRAPKR